MLKFYTCIICEANCIGVPLDGEIYELELCGAQACIDSYDSRANGHPTGTEPDTEKLNEKTL